MTDQEGTAERRWISAKAAETLLVPAYANSQHRAQEAIIHSAASGLIDAKCRRATYSIGGQIQQNLTKDNSEIGSSFWESLQEIHKLLDWVGGNFSTVTLDRHRNTVTINLFGVMFCESGIKALLPTSGTSILPQAPAPEKPKPAVSPADLQKWWAIFSDVHKASSEDFAWRSAKAMFPDNTVSRDRVRDLRGDQPIGRPKSRD